MALYPALSVLSPGFLTTVQDPGRYHCAEWGISPAGAADCVALRLGNLLVGNPPDCAGLEMTLVGGSFKFNSPRRIAITGSYFKPTIDDQPVPLWQSLDVVTGQVLHIGSTESGARCYLCVEGGIEVGKLLSSSSTHVLTSLGGFGGRGLKAGDVLDCGPIHEPADSPKFIVRSDVLDSLYHGGPIRVVPGLQSDWFSPSALSMFSSSEYSVKEESNRMGLRLAGAKVVPLTDQNLVTEGASLGSVQIPPDGEPILLFVEHPTTGGYPKIAGVILADLHRIGQLRPRDKVTFRFVTEEEAVFLLAKQESLLQPGHCLVPAP